MEDDSTNAEMAERLRNAGASENYIDYYLTAMDMGISTPSTNHAEKVLDRGVEYSGGSFHDSLWNDSPRYPYSGNPYGADSTNLKILKEAGIITPIEA